MLIHLFNQSLTWLSNVQLTNSDIGVSGRALMFNLLSVCFSFSNYYQF